MSEKQAYTVTIYEPKDDPKALAFTFVPKEPQQFDGDSELRNRVPQYSVVVRGTGENVVFDWSRTQDDPAAAKVELEREAQQRINTRTAWAGLISDLVSRVEQWGRELGWATRRIEKSLEDSHIGKHQVPALLMQEGTCRILLEPVGRSAPGVDGVVDLYLLPVYDDIASLYFYENRWHLHYLALAGPATATAREAAGVPLSKEALQKVLEELKAHAS